MSVISVRPVTLPAPGRGDDLQVRVTAPLTGDNLPVIVFSHGYHQSMDGYAPLVDFWSDHGFAVVQPTHLDSAALNVPPGDPRYPEIWRHRVDDLVRVLDHLDLIEAAMPGLAGRLDRDRIAVAGHSWGAQSASMLLGARVEGSDEDRTDPRVKAGVLFALTGTGGAKLTPFAAEHFPFMNPDFSRLTTPSLLVAGDKDQSMLSPVGPEWFTEAYELSPGIRTLLTVHGGEHSLGGINGYLSTETTDESPERVALIQRVSTAFLRGEPLETDTIGHLDNK
ncbi:alpha/beta hydrolase family protein [Actinoplanes sp. HUAS TT8]|uniref:alpha/beta hydrolase family protein n=1 Tax=Actinoplanes sp. HUAS TT8 TaxID=3447453 RepID=UPI003F51AF78